MDSKPTFRVHTGRVGQLEARPLSAEEVGHVQQVARRIAAVLLLGPALDASYQDCVLAHG